MDYTYSVSIPHYNSPKLLARMLKSIPEREDIQVIVVDDGSNEDNVAELKNLQHKNLELILLGENHGGGYARNVGLQHASGRWFISVDADDCFSEDAFEVFDKYKGEGIDCLAFCVKCVDTVTGIVTRELVANRNVSKYLSSPSGDTEKLLRFHNLEAWNKLVSMDFIRRYNIHFENCRINIDVLYSILIGLNAKNYKVIPDELYYFTENPESITHKKRSVEREFQFYLQVQKRNGFYWKMGLRHLPFYRHDILYLPYMLKKRGIRDTVEFFKLWWQRREERLEARKAYLFVFENKSKP